ncbi:unnamed protein product, partial [Penicillium discolor]
ATPSVTTPYPLARYYSNYKHNLPNSKLSRSRWPLVLRATSAVHQLMKRWLLQAVSKAVLPRPHHLSSTSQAIPIALLIPAAA